MEAYPTAAPPAAGFRIVSPLEGDRYQVPPGVEARYATIALRAAGAPGDAPVRVAEVVVEVR